MSIRDQVRKFFGTPGAENDGAPRRPAADERRNAPQDAARRGKPIDPAADDGCVGRGTSSPKLHIRWMTDRDVPAVTDVERMSYAHPWSADEFYHFLKQRHCYGWVVQESFGKLIGFFLYHREKPRLYLLNFAVHPDWRRLGVGAEMVRRLKRKTDMSRFTRLAIDVSESNLRAQLFLRSHGFRCRLILKDFFDEIPEDAYVMEYLADAART